VTPLCLNAEVLTDEAGKVEKAMVISKKAGENDERLVDLLNDVLHECLLSAIHCRCSLSGTKIQDLPYCVREGHDSH
jgi:hypothetical protein